MRTRTLVSWAVAVPSLLCLVAVVSSSRTAVFLAALACTASLVLMIATRGLRERGRGSSRR